jgi:hypothetical protein
LFKGAPIVEFEIEISGDVVERQELLNGTQIVTLEGASDDGRWTMSGLVSWNIGLANAAAEGDITLSRDDGAEIFGTLARGDLSESDDGDIEFKLAYDVDGGAGEFVAASGRSEAVGVVANDSFSGRWGVTLNA